MPFSGAEPGGPAISPARRALKECLGRLCGALQHCARPGAGLIDPSTGEPTPGDHYGQTGAALALLIARGAADDAWTIPLAAWRALPASEIGHAPFNRFLIDLMIDVVESPGSGSTLAADRARCALRRGYPSNNWALLAQLCRLIEARDARSRASQARAFVTLLDRWTTASGGFIDYPARARRGGRGATPIAYHHKALFLATVAAWYSDDPALAARIERMLAWSMLAWDGVEHAGGFGRSTHALYGDACLVAALVLLGYTDAPGDTMACGRMLAGMTGGWLARMRPDGLLPLNPASAAGGRSGWDDYMHLTVYNAWTAAVVAWAVEARSRRPVPAALAGFPADIPPLKRDDPAGLLRADSGRGLFVAVATRGQPPQGFGRDRIELRYAGGVPFHATLAGRVVCPAPARASVDAVLAQPALAGWTPVFLVGAGIYALTDFDDVAVEETPEAFRIRLRGRPLAAIRRVADRPWSRLLDSIDWRIGGHRGRLAALRRPALPGVEAELSISIERDRPRLTTCLVVSKRTPAPVVLLNPGGHALTAGDPQPIRFLERVGDGIAGGGDAARLSFAPLDAALPGSFGWCLPRVDLPTGRWGVRLVLDWPAR